MGAKQQDPCVFDAHEGRETQMRLVHITRMIALATSAFGALALVAGCTPRADAAPANAAAKPASFAPADYRARLPQDEVIYFVIPDRFANGDPSNDQGGLGGTHLNHGFEPTMKGFYHGGDLKGLISKLDYIQGMGVTAIWLGPIYQNKAVQGPPGLESAGYHGYWITDFNAIDAHLGSEADMKAFADALHARGIKLYLDIITNHTADVIQYRECADPDWTGERVKNCPYRALAEYPYTTRGDRSGKPINPGFMGHFPPFQTKENFARLTDLNFAYTPYIPKGEEAVKSPAWLNDMRYYHLRGDTTFDGESSTYGDFVGLDDLMTEHPDVVAGMNEIYKGWITRYGIDGFRIDTAKHVNGEFWAAFNPAMLSHAKAEGIPNFTIFGEAAHVGDSAWIARYTQEDGFPTMLDFGYQDAVTRVLVGGRPTYDLTRLFEMDALYKNGGAMQAPTFIGNHDMGRFAGFLRQAHPKMSDDEMRRTVELAHAIMFTTRGAPIIYYGDEQGFVSDGNDQLAREDMMPSRVAVYNDNDLIGTDKTTADDNFDTSHPLYTAIAALGKIRKDNEALRRGIQVERLAEERGGLYAFSRVMGADHEVLIVLNTRNERRTLGIPVDPRSTAFTRLRGACPAKVSATGVVEITLAPRGYMICKSNAWGK
jgi:neopullulanase